MDKELERGILKMRLVDFFKSYPKGISIFKKHHMGCIGCSGILNETVETSCLMHGLPAGELLKELSVERGRDV
ncbi:MAG: DUF1858 domain-containing protein [Deferribacteraceae bacterium]|nr:DUF1858 domain-containing protein [Deferribacteraceae bacterium]